jgi:hypothetical protein
LNASPSAGSFDTEASGLTIEEYNVKCRLLRAACPGLDPHVLLFTTGWSIFGYLTETAETPTVMVANKSYARAEWEYREAYKRLVAAGQIKPAMSSRST